MYMYKQFHFGKHTFRVFREITEEVWSSVVASPLLEYAHEEAGHAESLLGRKINIFGKIVQSHLIEPIVFTLG